MASITFAVGEELNKEISRFIWINLSELVKQELLRRRELLKRVNSKEEEELIKWSVELGRKVKEESFKKLISKLSPEEKKKLIKGLSPKKREEISKL